MSQIARRIQEVWEVCQAEEVVVRDRKSSVPMGEMTTREDW